MTRTELIYCRACKGTGLYIGMAERNGSAVVCHRCSGTGAEKITFEPFKGRKAKEGVKRVFSTNPGNVLSAEDETDREGNLLPFSKYGCTYEEWVEGAQPRELEFLMCPNMLRDDRAREMYKQRCDRYITAWQSYSVCRKWPEKEECWSIYHQKIKEAAKEGDQDTLSSAT